MHKNKLEKGRFSPRAPEETQSQLLCNVNTARLRLHNTTKYSLSVILNTCRSTDVVLRAFAMD